MARDDAPRQAGPTALSALFDDALKHLRTAQPAGDGFLFSGNRHESVPRALFLDRRLTPLERNAWQVFRLQLNDDGVTAFPTYDQLRPYLASMPCAAQASHETVARALTLLRLTRWLSLVRRRRAPKTRCSRAARSPHGYRCWHSASPSKRRAWRVIHRMTPTTITKKARMALFGMLHTHLRTPNQGRNPRRTPLFGIRRRTVQYVVVV